MAKLARNPRFKVRKEPARASSSTGRAPPKRTNPNGIATKRFAVPVLTQTEDVGDDLCPLVGG